MLVGRGSERGEVDALIARARAGAGGTLVVRGEAGIGKTALLEEAAGRADGFLVLHALGVESETELAYAALHELLLPLLPLVDGLPTPQASALRAALRLEGAGADPDRLGVLTGTLGLLGMAAAAQPVLCLVDDAQWIDASSADAVRFVARRLGGDAVAVLVGARDEPNGGFVAAELPTLRLSPLHREAAEALLDRWAPGLESELRARVLETCGGNPLALREVPASRESLDGIAGPLPVGQRVETAFLGRVRQLPDATRRALLVLAAAGVADGATVAAALQASGLPADALDAAEQARLVEVAGGTMRFQHPLVRSAVYGAADPRERRGAHAALAAAFAETGESEGRGWHAAAAAGAPDEEVARALEDAAAAAGARGAGSVRANALERAARLTPGREQRARRLLGAAVASWPVGLDRVEALCREALELADDPGLRAQIHAERETALYWSGDLPAAHRVKLETAAELAPTAPLGAAQMRARATASLRHFLRGREAVETARAAREEMLAAGGDDPRIPVMLAQALIRLGESAEARELLAGCEEALAADGDASLRMNAADVLALDDRLDDARAHLEDWLAGGRASRDISTIALALERLASVELLRDRVERAYAAALESLELSELLPGKRLLRAESTVRVHAAAAAAGREADAAALEPEALALARSCGSALLEQQVHAAAGGLALALGRPDEAIRRLEGVRDAVRGGGYRHPAFVQFSPELALAYVRVGRHEDAAAELELLRAEAELADTAWARAVAARTAGLLAREDDFEAHFDEAAAHHAGSPRRLEEALTALLHGERLRRAARRTEARERLHAALAGFESVGARAWAVRASDELRATGEHVRRRGEGVEQLTPQELRVAYAVAGGATNKEAAEQLFLSLKTIEFHLRNAYRKLGVRSRTELANALREERR